MKTESIGKVILDNGTEYTFRAGDKIVSKQSQDYYKMKELYNFRAKNSHWIACYHEGIKDMATNITLTQAGALILLLPYMQFGKGGLLMLDGKPLLKKDIQLIIGKSLRGTHDILNELNELGIIFTIKDGRSNTYRVSNKYHTKGKVIDKDKFTKLFILKLKEISKNLKLHEIGLLYKCLPYFHHENFHLSSNPYEPDKSKIKLLNRIELAVLIGHDKDTVYSLMNKLKRAGALLVISGKSNQSHYLIHPDLMYMKKIDTPYYLSVIDQFNQFNT